MRAQRVADFCAAAWPAFTPPLTTGRNPSRVQQHGPLSPISAFSCGGWQGIASNEELLNRALRILRGNSPPDLSTVVGCIRCGVVPAYVGFFLLIIGLSSMSVGPAAAGANPPCPLTMSNLSFGSVALSPSAIDVSATMSITCEAGGGPDQQVCVSIEAGSSGDATSRKMLNGGNSLRFELYKDAARTQKWGSWESGYAGTGFSALLMRGVTYNIPVYGRVFGSQSVPSGTYSSTFATTPYLTNQDDKGAACPVNKNSSSSSFVASITVLPSCTVSTTNMNFGTSGFIASNIDATATVSPNCASGAPYSVSLSNGNTGTGPTTRKMTNGGNSVTYGLYRDAGRSQPWGDSIGTNTVGGTGNGSAQPITVYGRVPPQTTPPPATYTDTVIVTVTY